jgi:hypothetical protein
MNVPVAPFHTRHVWPPAWTGFSDWKLFLPGQQLLDGLWPLTLPAQHPRVRPGPKVETPYHDNDLILTPIISPQSG